MAKKLNIVTGLDIGTTKVTAVVAELTNTGIDIFGLGCAPTEGLRKGVVVNIESTIESIKKAVEEAEFMSGVEVSSVFTGVMEAGRADLAPCERPRPCSSSALGRRHEGPHGIGSRLRRARQPGAHLR